MRLLGPICVALALLSAFVTFIVLADLTPISPSHYVVVSLLLANAATILLLLGVIAREVWQVVQARAKGDLAPGKEGAVTFELAKPLAYSPGDRVVLINLDNPNQRIVGHALLG